MRWIPAAEKSGTVTRSPAPLAEPALDLGRRRKKRDARPTHNACRMNAGAMNNADRTVLVTGATGRHGGAVLRHLQSRGWEARALTRHPNALAAQDLAGVRAPKECSVVIYKRFIPARSLSKRGSGRTRS